MKETGSSDTKAPDEIKRFVSDLNSQITEIKEEVHNMQDRVSVRLRYLVRAGPDVRMTMMHAHCSNYPDWRSEEHTSELQSLMRISYAVFRLKTKKTTQESQ